MQEQEYFNFSTTLPLHLWNKLLPHLRSPLSRTPKGRADRGESARWLKERVEEFLEGKELVVLQTKFLEERGMLEEFRTYYNAKVEDIFKEIV